MSAGAPPDLGALAQRAAALWRVALSRPVHPAGCTCMGHFLIPAMNARDMEADILDYMRGRYAAEGIGVLVALLDARAAGREATDIPAQPFRAWLLRLPDDGADPTAVGRFLADLLATLESFDRPAGPQGSGLICI
ncbi:hypothetical protein [Roseomonas sp. AR75]|jgi:hypothetical protein|uniref:hypothetical protein n=1 Tax=Roseomonas sp. AR75 TaxID=2562311 RepID=UPI0010C148B9|nr:hypothetical protein [Roseomonas sp. AR75]